MSMLQSSMPISGTSAVMTDDDYDNHSNVGDFTNILVEILGAPFIAWSVLELNLTFGAADSNVDSHRTTLHSPLSPLPPPLPSPPSSAAAEEPT